MNSSMRSSLTCMLYSMVNLRLYAAITLETITEGGMFGLFSIWDLHLLSQSSLMVRATMAFACSDGMSDLFLKIWSS